MVNTAGGRIDIPVEPDLRGFDSKLGAGLRKSTGAVGSIIKGLGVAVAAGTALAAVGLKQVIDKGREYEANLNELQAVSQATALDMKRVGDTAKALGADMSLPATSAADAAAAMVELAKGGLTVDQAMQAAKGTLQLAAAAQIDGAQAAEIQSNSLNAFRLSADQAGRVADVLANTANAAAGTIVDIGNSMKFVAPVSAALGVSIEHTAAAIGLLANQGIKGEQAGTSLRGILASLASPSKAAAKALDVLGVAAFDQQGKFVGLRAFTDQLAKAKGRLSQAEFAAASSTAFGNEGFTAANALAAEGAKAFDEMAVSVGRAGGAADVAAAKTKGLGGAIEGFNSQVETAGIGVFEKIAPTLEKGVRSAADVVAKITPAVVTGLDRAIAAGETFGPRLGAALKARGAVVGDAVSDVLGPIAQTIPGILNAGINAAIGLWEDFTEVLGNVVDAAKPVAQGIAAVAKAAIEADGPVSAVGSALGIVGDVARIASGFLVPIGRIVGGIAEAFADLPGPVQSAVIALGLVAAFRGPLGSLGDTVTSRVTGPFKTMSEEVRLQKALFDGTGGSIGTFGASLAALESRVPVMQKMRAAFEDGAAGAERFHRTAGLAAAAGTGIKSAATGIVSAFGGPWGIAIAGASLGLSLLAGNQAKAAQKAAEHKGWVEGLTQALRESKGVIDESIRQNVLKKAQDEGALDNAKKLGIAYSTVTDAVFNQGAALEELRNRLRKVAEEGTRTQTTGGRGSSQTTFLTDQAKAANALLGQLDGLAGGFQSAQDKQRQLDDAIRNGNVSMLDATGAGKTLSGAMGVLGDKTSTANDKARALKDALDALAGDEISLEKAQSRLNEQFRRLSDIFKTSGTDAEIAARNTKGFGAALLNANGSINTTLPNGSALLEVIDGIGESMGEVAQRTFDAAVQAGDKLPVALDKAKSAAQQTRDGLIAQAATLGLTADQVAVLADHYDLIPELVATAITTPFMTKAQAELVVLHQKLKDIPPGKSITMETISDEAKQKLIDLGFTVRTLPNGRVEVVVNDGPGRDQFADFIRDISNKSVGVNVVPRFSQAALNKELRVSALIGAQGHVVRSYAAGGIERKLTPMAAGIAQIVPPNTWRVVGDRLRDDEAYIPINQSARSLALLQETARRMGVDTIRRFALGGVAATSSVPISTSAGPLTIENHIEIGGEVVRVVRTEIRDSNRATRTRVMAGAGGDA